jgi:prepilin-type N-terminal cleavage/methylation domain-containing protein
MISLKSKQSGFTIVELLIVIVVIGILAGLVITTFNGIQQKGRNTERTTDIKAIHGQLEAYYAQTGAYPSLAQLNDSAWRATNMKGLDSGALEDPKGIGVAVSGTAGANVYAYVATPAGCDGDTANATNPDCTTYVLTATNEGGGTYVKNSLN